jgi:hypothetical protein
LKEIEHRLVKITAKNSGKIEKIHNMNIEFPITAVECNLCARLLDLG